jgi:transcriptional regulator with XRE-family HTH domain
LSDEPTYPAAALLAANVLIRREVLDLSQREFAERIGTTQKQISAIERGLANPRQSTVEAIATALRVPIHMLYHPSPLNRRQLLRKGIASHPA